MSNCIHNVGTMHPPLPSPTPPKRSVSTTWKIIITLGILGLLAPLLLYGIAFFKPGAVKQLDEASIEAQEFVKEKYYEKIETDLRANPTEARLPIGSELIGQVSTFVEGNRRLMADDAPVNVEALRGSSVLFYWPLTLQQTPRPLQPLPNLATIAPSEVVYYGALPAQAEGIPLETQPPFALHAPLPSFYKETDPDLLASPLPEVLATLAPNYERFLLRALLEPLQAQATSLASIGQTPSTFAEMQQGAGFALVREPLEPIRAQIESIDAFIDATVPEQPVIQITVKRKGQWLDAFGIPFSPGIPWQPLWSLKWDDPALIWISRNDIPITQ